MPDVMTIDFTGTKPLDDLAREFPQAAVRALNRTGRAAEVQANREIRRTWNISRAEVDKALTHRTSGVNRISKRGVMEYRIRARGGRVPWIKFNPRQTSTGVSVSIVKGQRKVVPHAFIQEMQSGHLGVFVRRGPKRATTKGTYKNTGILRQPIIERFTISVAEMFSSKKVFNRLDEFVGAKLAQEMNQQVSYLIRSGK